MNDERFAETQLRSWLKDALDPVPHPDAVLDDVSREVQGIRQRPRGSVRQRLRAWIAPHDKADDRMPPPERILLAGSSDAVPSGSAATTPAKRPLAVPLPVALAAIAVLAVSGGALLWNTPGFPLSPGIVVTATPTPSPSPALTLPPDTGAAREIVVALDGSGHTGSIEEAVAMARDGDLILIQPGTHLASVTIRGDIEIRGDGPRDSIVIKPREGAPELPPFAGTDPDNVGDLGVGQYVFLLRDSTARLSNLTVEGAEIGTAIAILGGAPTLEGLVVDPVGQQANKTASNPHEALAFGDGAEGTVRDSTLRAFIFVGGGSKPTLSGNTVEQACIYIYGDGADPTIRDNTINNSGCPNFAIGVLAGSAAVVQDNHINGVSPRGDGIRIHGAGSDPRVSGNVIRGGLNGIWVGKDAAPTLTRNEVTDAGTGFAIVGSRPELTGNTATRNDTGISVTLGASPRLIDNALCDNVEDIAIEDGTQPSVEGTRYCSTDG